MSSPKHTRGPWLVVHDDGAAGCRAIFAGDQGICCTDGLYDDEEDAANASLIAAAPEMFDTLDPDTLEAIADEIDCHEHSARAGSLRVIARRQRAAIAKATEIT